MLSQKEFASDLVQINTMFAFGSQNAPKAVKDEGINARSIPARITRSSSPTS